MKKQFCTAAGLLLFAAAIFAGPIQQELQPASGNTKRNQGDANKDAKTADQQKINPADRETTKKIRAALMDDKELSTYAHNIKIITRDGMVTLKGPVRSEDERMEIQSKAQQIAGASNVTNKLTIAPAKQ
jgi:osmotically-inducible protein OsmY